MSDTFDNAHMYDGKQIAEAIERYRIETGISLRDMADKVGIQLHQMHNLATGKSKRVQVKSVARLNKAFPKMLSGVIATGRKPLKKTSAGFGISTTR